ncbi:LysE family translocator [Streptomyces xanthii]|uniref:LysE family translocator n=1 Tax=Streptomyces xanthii TaxID=2768069 RepID=A0A7H1BJY7_9ACTN|nr:LysE family translocator [Streptomyces xanthii]
MFTAVLAFAGVALLINVAPGPDSLLVVRASVAEGRRVGGAAAVGVLVGCAGWGVATAAGLTALLTASRAAYDVLRVCGALYLVFLGVSALRRGRADSAEPDGVGGAGRGRAVAFRRGVATNLLNPKAGVFYMSLIPQFVPPGAGLFGTTLLLTAVDVVELALWYWMLARASSTLGERVRRPAFRRRLEQVTGVAFLGFAAGLLFDRSAPSRL